jgi:hypothetical protein
VPAARTSLEAGESLKIKVVVLSKEKPGAAFLRWREMGRGAFKSVPLAHQARGVFAVTLPPPGEAIEYYIEAKAGAEAAVFPASAPALNQTVIVLPEMK